MNAHSRQPWPLGIENNGLEPARNYFSTPEGLQFYDVATLSPDADARWLIAERNGALSVLDFARQLVANVGTAEDVAGIAAPCAPDNYVVAAEVSGGRDAPPTFQVVRQRSYSGLSCFRDRQAHRAVGGTGRDHRDRDRSRHERRTT